MVLLLHLVLENVPSLYHGSRYYQHWTGFYPNASLLTLILYMPLYLLEIRMHANQIIVLPKWGRNNFV